MMRDSHKALTSNLNYLFLQLPQAKKPKIGKDAVPAVKNEAESINESEQRADFLERNK